MKVSSLCSLIGCGIITIALIMHIVCLATPYYFSADFSNLVNDVQYYDNLTPQERQLLLTIGKSGSTMNNGLWKMCGKTKQQTTCMTWGDKIHLGDWMKGAQAMGILGILVTFAGAVVSLVNLVVESQGDRRRLVPFIIGGCSCLGGVFILCGDIIVASEYKSDSGLPMQPGQALPTRVQEILSSELYLNWGFGLDIVSGMCAILGGIVHIFAGRQSNASGMV